MIMNHEQLRNQAPTIEHFKGKDIPAQAYVNRNKWLKFYIRLIYQSPAVPPGNRFLQENPLAV